MAIATTKKIIPQLTLFAESSPKKRSSTKNKVSGALKSIRDLKTTSVKKSAASVKTKEISKKNSKSKVKPVTKKKIIKNTKVKKSSVKKPSTKKSALKTSKIKNMTQKKRVIKKIMKAVPKKRQKLPTRSPIEMRVWVEVLGEQDTVFEKDYLVQLQQRQDAVLLMQQIKAIVRKPKKK